MDLLTTSASDICDALTTGRLRPTELMAATYDQIEAWNPHVTALVSLLPRDQAMALAQEAETVPISGPLHGLPMAIKDVNNAKGFVTTEGSPLFADAPPAQADDLYVARLRAAGALFIGKTNVPEFALGSHTTNPVFGPTFNPYDRSRTAGGSSGGAAVALATGMVALADGSDMMGSLRNPAGWNNVYGFRPSWSAVPTEPQGETFFKMISTAGPMARSPDDLALLLSVMAGPDPRLPHGMVLPPGGAARPLRIGWLGDWGGAYAMEPGILDLCTTALQVLEAQGHEIVHCPPPMARETLWESWTTLRAWAMSASLTTLLPSPEAQARLGANPRDEIARGQSLTGLQVHQASVQRSEWFARAHALFQEVDVLALPTAQCWPFDVTLDYPRKVAGQAMDSYLRWMEVMIPASLIGLPALAVPAGFGAAGTAAAGLRMGLQLIGPRGSDYDLLALGQRYHTAAPWTEARPELPSA